MLALLKEREMYGYELASEIKKRSRGTYSIAILYPILYRLLEQGFIEESEIKISGGRARSYYRITPAGETYLDQTMDDYQDLSAAFDKLVHGPQNRS